MEYFNMMEVLVSDIVEEVFSKEESGVDQDLIKADVIAYVLNRVPARYVTSERGIIHGRIDSMVKFGEQTDILFLVHEAISLFSKRRKAEHKGDKEAPIWKEGLVPHMLGEVLEKNTLGVIPEVKITLLYGGEVVPMVDDNWHNPYVTSSATKGYFHFWPSVDEKVLPGAKTIAFTVKYEHEACEPQEVEVEVPLNKDVEICKTFSIPMVLLDLKEGADESILVKEI